MKEKVGEELAQRVKNGEIIGVGTGTTVDAALLALGNRVKKEGLKVGVVPTSIESAIQCAQIGLSVLSPVSIQKLSWGFDGADEVDPKYRLIKGRGGAMLLEKLMAAKCEKYLVIVDESKLVNKLGERCPVPVEVWPEAAGVVATELSRLGATQIETRQAQGKHGPIITEKGNLILDVKFKEIGADFEVLIKAIPGVVENGLFTDYADEILVAGKDSVRTITV